MPKFIKYNTTPFPDALIREADGLKRLAAALEQAGETGPEALRVPDVLQVSEEELTLPRIGTAPPTTAGSAALGAGLARMHSQKMPCYGLDVDNMIGLSRQKNTVMDDWGAFYVEYRLRPQLMMIKDKPVRTEFESRLNACDVALRDFLNAHCNHPSLLHGDLWAGNAMFDGRCPWLIDPAVYYGDREVDLATTELFGGFASAFYEAYDSVYPRTSVYGLKRPIYNLYHTLNHYNLFGAAYLGACRRNLAAFDRL
jgi:fructosamine-3-kinase